MKNLNLKKPSLMLKSILPLIKKREQRLEEIRLYDLGLIYITGKKTNKETLGELRKMEIEYRKKVRIFLEAIYAFQFYGIEAMLDELGIKPVDIDDMHDDYLIAACANIECLEEVINKSIRVLKKHGY